MQLGLRGFDPPETTCCSQFTQMAAIGNRTQLFCKPKGAQTAKKFPVKTASHPPL